MKTVKEIESKWQEYWKENQTYKFDESKLDNKIYCLEMFSYPSAAKLHMGHWWNFGVSDTWARLKRMQGYNVFHPMGFDAFGLPAENYAIKTGIHPKDSTLKNIETMEEQLEAIGATYDWDYEIVTCNPEYYKWTQWMFLELYKHGLAYKKEAPVNWCPSCNTVLANEQVIQGQCERCQNDVERKKMNQWFFKITDYAEELLNDLDDLDWPLKTKILQRNWIGKSVGAEVTFKIDNTDLTFDVFTTRVDTLYGCTYVVLAPENELVNQITTDEYKGVVASYKKEAIKQTEIDRMSTVKEKTGVFTGSYAINPINGKKVPIWIADYVLASYGTGAVMAVPAHDDRDYDFATKYDLDIIRVINNDDNEEVELPYCEEGVLTNSEELTGEKSEKAKKTIIEKLEKTELGKFITNYRLRDWLVSRQRYWGAPIPIVYCDKCGIVPDENLPVELPYNIEFSPDGKSPLAKSEEFMNCTCPKCGGKATREVDTLDTFVCSSWYFLRYPDNKNDKEAFNKDKINKFLPVDKYIGGIEHACMHLLYARFFTKALRDMGYLNFDEPFKSLVHQGIILGTDGEKMSKSRGNTVAPDLYVEQYGSDVLRLYLMFGFNYLDGGPWVDEGVKAVDKFYHRVVRLVEEFKDETNKDREDVEKVLHNSIKNIIIDGEKFQFNTCVSRIMEYVNILTKYKDDIKAHYIEQLVILLAPFAPHVTEELWEMLGHNSSIHNELYPKYDESKLIEEEKDIAVQVNGKVRATIKININDNEDIIKEKALTAENVIKHTEGKDIAKVIVIKGKIVNIVVK